MSDKFIEYQQGTLPLPSESLRWHLYGAGLENMGDDGKPTPVPMPAYGADELLVRHDAVGLCFSDTKVIAQGQNHPRIYKDMRTNPVTLGHEVSMTVVGVGENLRNEYHVGQRFIIQADIYLNGVSMAYGYALQGGMSQYNVIDERVMKTDFGNMLIPIQDDLGYAEGALVEPWACVVAAYRLSYRTAIKNGGTAWVIGAGGDKAYTISHGLDKSSHPAKMMLTNVPTGFAGELKKRAGDIGTEIITIDRLEDVKSESVDDIIILGADADLIEKASANLTQFGVMAVMADKAMPRKLSIDMGRIHYMRWAYVGSTSTDINAAYGAKPMRSSLKSGGAAWFVGAGGPIGRMHVQRAIQFPDPPAVIVASDVSDMRLRDLHDSFKDEAKAKGVEFICLNPTMKDAYDAAMARFFKNGFDDIIVLAPIPAVISESASHIAKDGVLNVFAGVSKGTMVDLDVSDVYLRNVRFIGHSGSTMDDMLMTLRMTEDKHLSPNRALAALGSLGAARDGLRAVKEQVFPGKVVIFNQIKEMPLTPITDLKEKMPSVYSKMDKGCWTVAAEEEFLRLMLP